MDKSEPVHCFNIIYVAIGLCREQKDETETEKT